MIDNYFFVSSYDYVYNYKPNDYWRWLMPNNIKYVDHPIYISDS